MKPAFKVIDRAGCGKIAFYTKIDHTGGLLMNANDFILPDGSTPIAGTNIVCGSCGRSMPYWKPEPNESREIEKDE